MKLRYVIAASAATLALGLGAPAIAQQSSVTESGPGSADNNGNDTANDFLDLLSNNALLSNNGNGDNRDNDANDNGDNRDNEANDNGDNRDNEANDNGDNRDNEWDTTADNGSIAASRGGEVEVGNSEIVADQTLIAINNNMFLDEVVDLDGEDDTDTPVGYNSGSNSVQGSAFAAFAGILNQAWNTGVNSNAQAATNIAAQGTVNFGSGASSSGGGGSGD